MTKQLILAIFCVLACSCSSVRIETPEGHVLARMPAWPWQDSTRIIERLGVTTKTNGATSITLRGLQDGQNGATNLPAIFKAMAEGAALGLTGR